MATDFQSIFKKQFSFKFQDNLKIQNKYYVLKCESYTPLVLDYTLPSTWPKSTQAEIQNDGGSLGLVISLKTRSRLSHLIKRESLMFSLRQYCLDFPIFTMIDSKFHFYLISHIYFQPFLLNQKQKWYMFKTHDIIHPCQM